MEGLLEGLTALGIITISTLLSFIVDNLKKINETLKNNKK